MANVALAFVPEPRSFPFHVWPGQHQEQSAIPLSRINFQLNNEVITAKIATNTTSIQVTCTLPANYAYTFEYLTVKVEVIDDVADADNFSDIGFVVLSLSDGLGSRITALKSDGVSTSQANAGSLKCWDQINRYCCPVFNQDGNSPVITLFINDIDAANTNEGKFSCLVSVLQFTLDQAFNYPLNFPLPVSPR